MAFGIDRENEIKNRVPNTAHDFLRPVKVVYPVCLQEIYQENDTAQSPGDRVCPGYRGQLIDQLHRYRYVGHAEDAPAGQHSKHRYGGFACATHNAGDTMGKGQQAIEQADGLHVLRAKIHGCLGFSEKADKLRGEHIGDNAYDFCHNAAANNAEANALFHSVVLLRT